MEEDVKTMPEPTPDLAAIVREIDVDMPYETASLLKHWPTIRANLMFGPPSTEEELAAAQCQVDLEAALLREDYANRRMAELEAALRELVEEVEMDANFVVPASFYRVKALLAPPAKEPSDA